MAKTRSRKTQELATWKSFSRYIRMRDSIRTTGTLSEVECFTCGRRVNTWGEAQAGHIISRSYNGALFNEKVVHAQCVTCNHRYEGNHILGFFHLADMIGMGSATKVVMESMKPRPFSMEDLEDIEEGCEAAVEVMEEFYASRTR